MIPFEMLAKVTREAHPPAPPPNAAPHISSPWVHAVIPLPPSANKCRRWDPKGRRFVKTKAYDDWLRTASFSAARFRRNVRDEAGGIFGAYEIDVELDRKCRMDVDNAIKPTCDLLVRNHVTPDDSRMERVTARKSEHDLQGCMIVRVRGLGSPKGDR